jgi:hypothetical protein
LEEKHMPYYHDKGEKDYAENKGYNPPNDDLAHHIFGHTQKEIEEDKDYDAGWANARKQDKH